MNVEIDMKKTNTITYCNCGHSNFLHGPNPSYMNFLNPTACSQNYYCKCFEFRQDNLRYLEEKYEMSKSS